MREPAERLIEELADALNYAWIYLPSVDEKIRHAEEYRSVIGRRFPRSPFEPILTRERAAKLADDALVFVKERQGIRNIAEATAFERQNDEDRPEERPSRQRPYSGNWGR